MRVTVNRDREERSEAQIQGVRGGAPGVTQADIDAWRAGDPNPHCAGCQSAFERCTGTLNPKALGPNYTCWKPRRPRKRP